MSGSSGDTDGLVPSSEVVADSVLRKEHLD
jgi:hypothetical protein